MLLQRLQRSAMVAQLLVRVGNNPPSACAVVGRQGIDVFDRGNQKRQRMPWSLQIERHLRLAHGFGMRLIHVFRAVPKDLRLAASSGQHQHLEQHLFARIRVVADDDGADAGVERVDAGARRRLDVSQIGIVPRRDGEPAEASLGP